MELANSVLILNILKTKIKINVYNVMILVILVLAKTLKVVSNANKDFIFKMKMVKNYANFVMKTMDFLLM